MKVWKKSGTFGNPPSGRRRMTICAYNDNIYLFGGFGERSCGDFFKFSLLTETWTRLTAETMPGARAGHISAVLGPNLFIHGGNERNYGIPYEDIWIFNFESQRWRDVTPYSSFPRQFHSSCVYEGKIILCGGSDGYKYYNDIITYDRDKHFQPHKVSGQYPPEVVSHSCFVVADTMYLVGGLPKVNTTASVAHSQQSMYAFHFPTCKWKKLDSLNIPSPRCNAVVEVIKGVPYLFGGYHEEDGLLQDMHVFDVYKLAWTRIEQKGDRPDKRTKSAMTQYENVLYLFGGFGGVTSDDMNDLYSYRVNEFRDLKSLMMRAQQGSIYSDVIIETVTKYDGNRE